MVRWISWVINPLLMQKNIFTWHIYENNTNSNNIHKFTVCVCIQNTCITPRERCIQGVKDSDKWTRGWQQLNRVSTKGKFVVWCSFKKESKNQILSSRNTFSQWSQHLGSSWRKQVELGSWTIAYNFGGYSPVACDAKVFCLWIINSLKTPK